MNYDHDTVVQVVYNVTLRRARSLPRGSLMQNAAHLGERDDTDYDVNSVHARQHRCQV